MRDDADDRVPELWLERAHLGELPPAEAAALADRLTPDQRAHLAELAAEDAALQVSHPPAKVAAEIRRRAGLSVRRKATAWGLGLTVAAAAAAALLVTAPPPASPRQAVAVDAPADGLRAKGDPRLLVFRNAGAEPELLLDGAQAKAGDALQLGVIAEAGLHGVIVSLDGAGVVTRHWPEGEGDTALPAGRVVLDFSYVLDDAPAHERFVLVTADDALDPAAVEAAAQAVAAGADPQTTPLALPEGWRQATLTLRKPEGE